MTPTETQAQTRLAQIEAARHTVLGGGLPGPSSATVSPLAPWVQRSWQRCLGRGMAPQQRVVFNAVSTPATKQALDQSQHLLSAAVPVIHSLARAMADTRYFAILTNAQGLVINVHGPIDRHDPHAALIARVGLDLSEQAVGTTAIGATLAEQQPVWLHRGEHFFDDTAMYSCAGAPLFGPDGQCVGMLDLTGVNVPERRALKHLVTQSARSIENALTLAQPHHLLLRVNWPGRVLGEDGDGLVCVDADGHITGTNRAAADMLNLASIWPPVPCSEVFAVHPDQLFDAARKQHPATEVPLWSGLRLQLLAQGNHNPPHLGSVRATVHGHGVPLKDVEAALIRKAVEQARGNVMEAARALGISRATVYRKLGKKS